MRNRLKVLPKDQKAELRRFYAWLWFLHLLAVVLLGLSLFPMVFFLYSVWKAMGVYPVWLKVLTFCVCLSLGYFLFGITLIFLCALAKRFLRFRISPGLYRLHSWENIQWMGYNGLILITNAAFLDVLRISPLQTLFYRLMGAKIGWNVHVNTGGLADLSLLEIGDEVVIGGGVALVCHAFDRGFFRLERSKIGNGVSIGIGSVLMPGCEIGEGATVMPCSFLPRGTRIPPRAVWGGNPACDLREARRLAF